MKFEGFHLNIRNVRPEEARYSLAGHYTDSHGKVQLITNPQAVTLRILRQLKGVEQQFEFYRFTILRSSIHTWERDDKYRRVIEEFVSLKNKYGMPWSAQAYNLLPLDEWPRGDFMTDTGIDNGKLMKKFQEYGGYEFVLYDSYIDVRDLVDRKRQTGIVHKESLSMLRDNIESLIAYKRAVKILEKSMERNPSTVRVNAVILSLGVEKALKALLLFQDNKQPKKIHPLDSLFERLSHKTKLEVWKKVGEKPVDIVTTLKKNDNAFIEWRYLEESHEELSLETPAIMIKLIDASIQLLKELSKK